MQTWWRALHSNMWSKSQAEWGNGRSLGCSFLQGEGQCSMCWRENETDIWLPEARASAGTGKAFPSTYALSALARWTATSSYPFASR